MEIARLLLDAGADPNAFFHAGDSHYTAMTGVAGEGEEGRPPHPRRDELTQLFLDHGANPYDIQVVNNLGFHAEYLWCLPMIYAHSVTTGRADDWRDPEWKMLDMGGYGCGARWFLDRAIRYGNVDLAADQKRDDVVRLLLDAGFSPNVADDKNTRALNHTAWLDAIDAARALVERGAEIDSVEENYGGTPFGNASHFLHKRVMYFLAPLTKDVWNLKYNGYLDRLREVLAEDLGVRAPTGTRGRLFSGFPPHDEDVALEIVKLCVHYGADPRRRDSNGIAPVDRAEALGMTRVVAYLRGLGRQE